MKKKMLAAVLSLLLLGMLLSGCSTAQSAASEPAEAEQTATSASQQPAPAQSAQTAPAQTADSSQTTAPAQEEAAPSESASPFAAMYDYELPLAQEPVTFTCLTTVSPRIAGSVGPLSENKAVQELEKLTGVHIEYNEAIPETMLTTFQLQVASGDLSDMINGGLDKYGLGMDSAVEEGVFTDINTVLDYCPNYKAILDANPNMVRDLTSDEGHLSGFTSYSSYDNGYDMTNTTFIRGDWLEKLNMSVPATYDEVYECLKAFKTELNVEQPMIVTSYFDAGGKAFAIGYDCNAFFMTTPGLNLPIYVKDGQVKFAPMEDDFYNYLSMLAKWYGEGLTNTDIESTTNEMTYADKIYNGATGFFWEGVMNLDVYNERLAETGGYLSATPVIRQTAGQALHFDKPVSYSAKNALQISTTCGDTELLCKWIDYHFGESASMLSVWGYEGETFEYDDAGVPHYTDFVTNNPDGLADEVVKYGYMLQDGVSYGIWNTDTYSDAQLKALDLINGGSHDSAYYYPEAAAMTTPESEEYSNIVGDLATYMAEQLMKFVRGDQPLDQYDAFKAQCKELGADRVAALYQAAYDRYIAKG